MEEMNCLLEAIITPASESESEFSILLADFSCNLSFPFSALFLPLPRPAFFPLAISFFLSLSCFFFSLSSMRFIFCCSKSSFLRFSCNNMSLYSFAVKSRAPVIRFGRFLIIAASGNGVVKISAKSAGISPAITSGLVGLTEVLLILIGTEVGVEFKGATLGVELTGKSLGVGLAGTAAEEELPDVGVTGTTAGEELTDGGVAGTIAGEEQ